VKKLISIGVALALLAMVVVPAAVAADEITPSTYSKIPFAIIGSGIQMLGEVAGLAQDIVAAMGVSVPFDLGLIGPITDVVGNWTAGPLAWSVDMLAWGVDLFGTVYGTLDTMFGIGYPELATLCSDIAAGLRDCWTVGNCT
jgi:hypothetical protein